jgi:hypothetical protein
MLGSDELQALMRDPEAGDLCLRDRPEIGAEICDVRGALKRLEAAAE